MEGNTQTQEEMTNEKIKNEETFENEMTNMYEQRNEFYNNMMLQKSFKCHECNMCMLSKLNKQENKNALINVNGKQLKEYLLNPHHYSVYQAIDRIIKSKNRLLNPTMMETITNEFPVIKHLCSNPRLCEAHEIKISKLCLQRNDETQITNVSHVTQLYENTLSHFLNDAFVLDVTLPDTENNYVLETNDNSDSVDGMFGKDILINVIQGFKTKLANAYKTQSFKRNLEGVLKNDINKKDGDFINFVHAIMTLVLEIIFPDDK